MRNLSSAPAAALLVGAAVWGVLWYPYRLLAAYGVDGIWSTLFTYGFALLVGIALFPRHARALWPLHPLATLMGLCIGWSNLAYVLGVLEGEVMRVLLLFYLAPLWTVPLARIVLKERAGRADLVVMALAFAGAMTMLWRPELGAPWPSARAEWLGVIAGFLFALGNVLIRRLEEMSDVGKSMVIWAGVTLAAFIHLPGSKLGAERAWSIGFDHAPLIACVALALILMSLALQYGLSRMAANRAIVILLFELVVAAVASYYLAGERLRPQDGLGGALIVMASLASALRGKGARPSS